MPHHPVIEEIGNIASLCALHLQIWAVRSTGNHGHAGSDPGADAVL